MRRTPIRFQALTRLLIVLSSLLLGAALLLSGCGGDDDQDDNSSDQPATPDLAITNIELDPEQISAGQAHIVKVYVSNVGDAPSGEYDLTITLRDVTRGTSSPIYPFFDRGATLWGEILQGSITYNLGVYTGAGVDLDATSGDIDDFKDLAGRLFLQPFKLSRVEALRRLYLVAQGTWGLMSIPTSRYDIGGLRSASYETAIWRWRTEQIIGSDGRVKDLVSATVEHRIRAGVELHYLIGPFVLSAEYLEAHYRKITLYHDLLVGSSREVHERLLETSGAIRSLSIFASVYLTGEKKKLTNGGWRTAKPNASLECGGPGAWELLLRYSVTWTGENLFERARVQGFLPDDEALPDGYSGATPGAGNSVNATVLDGAHLVHELSLGLNWTLNPMVRIQINDVFLWAPASDRDDDGENDNMLVSGAKSNQSDPDRKNRKLRWENAVMARLIFKL